MKISQTLEKITSKDCIIEIFGLGYVGFPLSVRLANSGFDVIGIDTDSKKIDSLKNKILQGSQKSLKKEFDTVSQNGKFTVSQSPSTSDKPKIAIICVPTPIAKNGTDSNVFVNSSVQKFLGTSNAGDMIILESSVIAGTTEQIQKTIESQGYKVGEDFGFCFCPERIDPLNQKWKLENIPRVIYASDDTSFKIAQRIYRHVNNSHLIRITSPKVAEVVKSFENAFRLVNISLVNELAVLCDKLHINVKEVIDAASTKPFGFMPFYSGAGAGGHCIPKDPKFLADLAKKMGLNFTSIEGALALNSQLPRYICDSIQETIEEKGLAKSVVVCGLSYKPDIEDMRDSAGFKILNELKSKGFRIAAYDPFYKETLHEVYLSENNLSELEFTRLPDLNDSTIKGYSCICIVQNHTKTKFRLEEIYKHSIVPLIYDCQNNLVPDPNSKTVLETFGY